LKHRPPPPPSFLLFFWDEAAVIELESELKHVVWVGEPCRERNLWGVRGLWIGVKLS